MNPQVIDRFNITQDQKAELKRLLFRPSNEGGDPAKGLMRLRQLVPSYATPEVAAPSALDVARSLVRLGLQTARRVAPITGDAQDAKDLGGAGELVAEALQHDAPDFAALAKGVKGSGAGCAVLKTFCELAASGLPKGSSKSDDSKSDGKKK